MTAYEDRCEREDEEDRLGALRAQAAWEVAGRPGPDPQIPLFPAERYRRPEVEWAQLRDRPRVRRPAR